MENQKSYRVFVFRRGNDYNGFKLNEDGSIVYEIKTAQNEGEAPFQYVETVEMTFESKYGEEPNSDAYNLISTIFTDGDVLQITSTIDDNGVFTKKIEKVMDKEFCENVKKSWDSIKHNWFTPDNASKRIEDHIASL